MINEEPSHFHVRLSIFMTQPLYSSVYTLIFIELVRPMYINRYVRVPFQPFLEN